MISRFLLLAIGVALAVVLTISDRPWPMTNQPAVLHVQALPDASQARLRDFLGLSGIILPRREPKPGGAAAARFPVALGYSYREFTAFRMPFFAYGDFGLVLFDEGPEGQRMVPLDADSLRLLEAETGQQVDPGYRLPVWRFLWGWLFVAALVGWYALARREEDQRRFAEGRL